MIWTVINCAQALVGVLLAPLVVYGYARILRFDSSAAQRMILLAVICFTGAALARMGWWDGLRVTIASLDLWGLHLVPRRPLDGLVNVWISSFTIAGELLALRALHLTIPSQHRYAYCWLTAPFYPPRRYRSPAD